MGSGASVRKTRCLEVYARLQDVYQRFVAILTFYYPLGARLAPKESYIPTLQIRSMRTVIFSIYLHVIRFNPADRAHGMLVMRTDNRGNGIYTETMPRLPFEYGQKHPAPETDDCARCIKRGCH